MERRKFTREFKLTAVRKVVDLGVRRSENTVAKGMKQAGILVVGAKRFLCEPLTLSITCQSQKTL